MEYFRLRAGFTTTPVPYGGSAPLVNDLLAGQFKVAFGATVGLVPHVNAGSLRALAISSDRRSDIIPNVPTVAESGYPGFRLENDFIILVQGQTPDKIVAILENAIHEILKEPEVKASFAKQDIRVVASTSEEARKRIEADRSLWVDVIRETGMRVN
jgi:tripartite-type tricarboxylate transporter receptor subunit TctC